MALFSLSSLRSRAIGLVLLAILPLLALTLYGYFHQRDADIREVQKDALTAAKTLARMQEAMISDTKRLLMTLSQMPEVQKFDRAGGNALFAMMLEENPYYNAILAVDRQGQLVASVPPARAPLNFADRFWFKKVLQTKTFSIGELVKGRITGRYVFDLSYPIANRQGDLQGVIMVGTNLEWWGNLLTQMGFTPDTAMVFSDSSQKVLYRYPDPEKYVGRELPEAVIKAMALGNAGVAAGVGLPGDPRLFAFARLAPPWQEMWVSIGLPRDVAVAPAKQALKRNLVFLFLVALLALAAAWYFGEYFVVRPVHGLLGVTKRLAAGDLTVRAGAAYRTGELGLLASSFDHMAASLQKRDTELAEQRRRLMQAVQDLGESEEQLRLAQKAAHVGIWEWQPQKQVLAWTPELEKLYGLQPGTISVYQDWSRLVHPEDLPRVEAELDAAVAGHLPFNSEFRICHASGQSRWIQAKGGTLYGDDGSPVRVFGVNIDITERKRAEEAVRQSQKTFSELIERAPFGIYVVDSQFCIAIMNRGSQEGAFRNVQPVIGRDLAEAMRILWPGPVAAEIIGHFRHTLETGEPYFSPRFVNPRADVEIVESYEWELQRLTLPDGQHGVICYYYDSTNLRQAEAALRESQAQLQTVFDNLSEGVVVSTLDGQMLNWNRSALEMHGLASLKEGICRLSEIKEFYELRTLDGAILPFEDLPLSRILRGEQLRDLEIQIHRLDKEFERIFSYSGALVRDPEGVPMLGIVSMVDITERKQAEMLLQRQAEMLYLSYDAIIVWQLSGGIESWNRGAAELYGYSAEEAIGRVTHELLKTIHPKPWPQIEAELVERRFWEGELKHHTRDGREVIISARTQLLRGSDGIERVLEINRDITARQRAEEALRQLNEELENRVAARTSELSRIVEELLKEIVQRQQAEQALKESEDRLRLLAGQLINAQEQERKLLAAELHDQLGHSLLILKLSLGSIIRKLPPAEGGFKQLIQEQLQYLDNLIEQARRLYYDLSPGELEDLGLNTALENLIEEFCDNHPDITCDVELPELAGLFDLPVQITIYRLVQEALTNVGKHAEATEIKVWGRIDNQQFRLLIEDDGQGFDVSEVEQNLKKGIGLAAMKERLNIIKGSLEIESKNGQGTRLNFSMPVLPKAA